MKSFHPRHFIGGLAVVALAAIFFFAVNVGVTTHHQRALQPDPLSTWSLARIMEELGEYDQKFPDCAGLVQGMTGYAFGKADRLGQLRGVVIVCKP